jgi:hypothetical protein
MGIPGEVVREIWEFGKSFMPDVANWDEDAPNPFEDEDDETLAEENQEGGPESRPPDS